MLPDASAGLALVKPAVRAQAAYSLAALSAPRKLNQNESPLDLPEALKARILGRAAALPWHRYPAFLPAALQERLAARHGWVGEGVLTGNGSNELIQAVLAVTLGPGTAVVAPAPTFALYRLLTAVLGGHYVPVPLGPGFSYDIDAMVARARETDARLVVLNSPNNPTGSALPALAVERFLAETRAMVVCDEAYQEFGGPTAVPLLAQSSRVIVLRTFSKAMGLAGLRFGYALAHPAVIAEVAKAKLPYNVNAITLAAAEEILADTAELEQRVAVIVAERERMLHALRALPGLEVYPSQANFFVIRCRAVPARQVFARLHGEFGILVRDISGPGALEECLRISIGTREDMDAVHSALRTILLTEQREAS
ncbi:MAG TPA: histidinol-phosphate transaminase [Gemmatimonadales bacterium]|nr:histidinol-phosphate transaminase [Gemmatimonadales bacterium]